MAMARLKSSGSGYSAELDEAERASREVLALPMFAELTDAEVERVAKAVRESLDEK